MNFVGHRRPAQNRRCGTGGSADHNILWGRALQPRGVDHGVTDQRKKREDCRQRIDDEPENDHRNNTEGRSKGERGLLGELTLRQRPALRAHHLYVDAGIEYVIKDGC